jgi:hypothetical protein
MDTVCDLQREQKGVSGLVLALKSRCIHVCISFFALESRKLFAHVCTIARVLVFTSAQGRLQHERTDGSVHASSGLRHLPPTSSM